MKKVTKSKMWQVPKFIVPRRAGGQSQIVTWSEYAYFSCQVATVAKT